MQGVEVPPEWAAHGASFGQDGLLYLPDWRRGFTIHELRAMWFQVQQVRSLESRLRLAERDFEALEARFEITERNCAFYRRQCTLEARLGLALSRIA